MEGVLVIICIYIAFVAAYCWWWHFVLHMERDERHRRAAAHRRTAREAHGSKE